MTVMQKILLLEDDAALGKGIVLALQGPETQITLCPALSQARAALAQNRFDLLILDVNPLAGRLLEQGYWFYRYHYTITPVLLMIPIFLLLGWAIPSVMYRHAAKHSVVERLREAES